MTRHQAILLLGPTGSGKTPLGDYLQDLGLWGRSCHHFDFGRGLREVAAGRASAGFTAGQMRYIQDVVEKGTLLENETFYLASKILCDFILRREVHPHDLLVMNGLPRHIGQAEALSEMLQWVAIVHLECSAETVWERLRNNAGGDRTHRADDDVALVERKLAIFTTRTQPLLTYYQERNIPLNQAVVGVQTQPADIRAILETAPALPGAHPVA